MKFPSKFATVLLLQAALLHNALYAYAFYEPFNAPVAPATAGWNVQNGSASLVTGQPGAVGSALQLSPSAGEGNETRVVRPITWNAAESIAFIDFLIKPAANPEGSLASIYVNGTQVAFQVPAGSQNGEVWGYHGNQDDPQEEPEAWLKTPAGYQVTTTPPQATGFSRVTLRHDYGRKVWDLFVDGKLSAANLGFEGRGVNLDSISFYGSEVAAMLVDELKADPVNMLFPDADKDGLPDAWETANGSNPNLYDRDAINSATGKSFLDDYLASLWSGATAPNGSSGTGAVSSASIPPLTILSSHQPVGALKGAMSVGGDGSSTYSIPIDVPKGTAGMEPKLSLGYSSGAGSSQLGVGWSLGGLQKIIRGGSTAAKDGVYDPVDFDSNDRFFLNGERLVCVSGTYGSAGSEYRTEMDSYSRITLNNGTHGLWWKLESKAGLIVEIGNTADSIEKLPAGILTWNVNKVSDTLGNYYSVSYVVGSEAGVFTSIDHRVDRIDYTGKDGASPRAPYCSVQFVYEERPDKARYYTPHAGYRISQRLAKVLVKTGSFVNHSYRLSYQTSYQSNRSFLTAIGKYAEDKDTLAIPPTTFTYDGLQSGQPMWQDSGEPAWRVYNGTWDATGAVNSEVTVEDGGTTVVLSGDASRVHTLASPVTLASDTKVTFEFKGESFVSGACIGVETDDTYQASTTKLFLVRGSGSPPAGTWAGQTNYTGAGGWQTVTFNIGQVLTGAFSRLVLVNFDETLADGVSTASFRNVRFYQSGTQQPTDVSPLSFPTDWQLPHIASSTDKDFGVRFVDLDGDGRVEVCDWRVTDFLNQSNTIVPVTAGKVYRNTGSNHVVDNTLLPPSSLPLSLRESETQPKKWCERHHLLAEPVDINNDGRPDLLGSTSIDYTAGKLSNDLTFHTFVNGSWQELTGYKLPFRPTNLGPAYPYGGLNRDQHFQWVDLDGDGYQDMIFYTSQQGNLVLPGTGLPNIPNNTSTAWLNKVHLGQGWVRSTEAALPEMTQRRYPSEADLGRRFLDVNADGRPDIIEAMTTGYGEVRKTYLMTTATNGAITGWNSTPGLENPPASSWDLPAGTDNAPFVNAAFQPTNTLLTDLNGDGLPDVFRSLKQGVTNSGVIWLNRGGSSLGTWVKEENPALTYLPPKPLFYLYQNVFYPMGYELTDLNGDGLVDILYSNPDTDNLAILNTGEGWMERSAWGLPGTHRIFISTAHQLNNRRSAKLQDLNGDGFPDLITGLLDEVPRVWLNNCKREVLTSVTDGFGSTLGIEYRRLNDPTPVAGTTTPIYQVDTGTLPAGHKVINDDRLVVARLIEPDGRGGLRGTRRHYGDLRTDGANESSLGFGWAEVHSEFKTPGGAWQPKGYTRTETSRTYPHGGSPVLARSYAYVESTDARLPGVPAGYRLVSEETSTYGELATTTGTGGKVRRPVQIGAVTQRWDLDGTLMSKATTSQPVASFDAYGFLKSSAITALDGSSISTTSVYTNTTTGGKWHLGRLTSSTVTKTAPGKTSSVKSTSFTYNATTGLLQSETVQPGDPLSVTKTYTHDASGNVIQTSVSASGQTRTGSTAYDANARFVISETSALGTVTFDYDPSRALLLSATDLDGLTVSYDYDAFGTKLVTRNPDGTSSAEITRYASNADLPSSVSSLLDGSTIKWARAAQASATPWATIYFDALGREVARETLVLTAFNGTTTTWRPVYAVTCYDAKGRTEKSSLPFHAGDSVYWTSYGYDPVDRIMITQYPDGSADKVILYSTGTIGGRPVSYSKLQNRVNTSGPTNPWDVQYLERWEDQHGRMIQSKDMSGLTNTFTHDVEGNVMSVSVGGTTMFTNTWDIFGRKTSVVDVDAGTSSTVYNGFGAAVSSTNARGETTTMSYDALGRVTDVVRPNGEGAFHSTYRTTSPAKGKPDTVTGPNGWSEGVSYDTFGRPVATSTTRFGETFATQTVYDALGRVSYSVDAGGLKVIHDYDSTFSAQVRSRAEVASGPAFTLWEARAYDAAGRATQEFLAQGVTVDHGYVATNGKLASIQSARAGTTLQNLAYTWDAKTNLTSRTDHVVGRTEAFAYDTNNRLTSSVVGGQSAVTYGYAANGNLTQKGADTLTYADARPHAVSSATIKGQSRSFGYDAAGALVSDGIRTYGWASTSQLKWIAQSSCPQLKTLEETGAYGVALPGIPVAVQYDASYAETSFDFDAAGSRARQYLVRTFADTSMADVTTLYLGSYEREIHRTTPAGGSPGVTKTIHRHHLRAAVYVIEDKIGTPGPVHRLTTLLTDHLGSTDVMLVGEWNGSAFAGQKVERQSFDVWGERRDADTWTKYRSAFGDARRGSGVDFRRGFTGHEMLDDFGLIHMNGRIYDAELGRFFSPDPVIQVPEWSQNFNAYTYVLNNPLSYTDPSGHFIPALIKHFAHEAFAEWASQYPEIGQVVAIIVAVVVSHYAGPQAGGAAGNAIGTKLQGGDFGDVVRSAAVGAVQGDISAGILHSMGATANTAWATAAKEGTTAAFASATLATAQHVAGHALLGGFTQAALGGKFQDGFLSGAVTTLAFDLGISEKLNLGKPGDWSNLGKVFGRVAVAGMIGGTASAIGGGKFGNGAWTGAFQHLANAEAVIVGGAIFGGAAAGSGVGAGGSAAAGAAASGVAAPITLSAAAVAAGFTIGAAIGRFVGKQIGFAIADPLPQEVAAELGPTLPSAGVKYRCLNFAAELGIALSKRKIDYNVVVYSSQPEDQTGIGGMIVADYGLFRGGVVSDNGNHAGIIVGSQVFDNNAPQGVPFTTWTTRQFQRDIWHGVYKSIGQYTMEGRAVMLYK